MKKLILPFFCIGTIAMILVMNKTGAALKTSSTSLGILDLEFAYSAATTTSIINTWELTKNITVAKTNTYWDFLFIFFYAGLLFVACKKIGAPTKGLVAKAGNLIGKGAILAGFFDVLENAGMLLTLNNQGSETIAFLTTFFSVIKWGLVTIAILYSLTGLLVLAYRKIK